MDKIRVFDNYIKNLDEEQFSKLCVAYCKGEHIYRGLLDFAMTNHSDDMNIELFNKLSLSAFDYDALKENAIEELVSIFRELSDFQISDIHNALCDEYNYTDDYIYTVNELSEHFALQEMTPLEVLESVELGFDVNCHFAAYNDESGKYISFDCISDYKNMSDYTDMAVYILENDNPFGDYRIEKLLAIYEAFEKEM